jgi:acetyltransferase-like isoleucine patch superfamily enzyme
VIYVKDLNGVTLGRNVVVEEDVLIEEGVEIGHNSVILKGTHIMKNSKIGNNCVIGIKPQGNNRMRGNKSSTTLLISENVKIGNLVSIYSGTTIGQHVFIGDHASIRENVIIDQDTVVGRGVIIELNSTIGKACTIQTLAYVTGDTIIEDHVFIGPCVSMSNDKYMGKSPYELKGPVIKKGASIGNNATLLPGVIIDNDSVVGAGSVVTKDVQNNRIVVGNPARILKRK